MMKAYYTDGEYRFSSEMDKGLNVVKVEMPDGSIITYTDMNKDEQKLIFPSQLITYIETIRKSDISLFNWINKKTPSFA